MSSGRRSSILKLPKKPIELVDDDDQERQNRKVRFSSNFVKPYTTEENATVWDTTYEEPIKDSSWKLSSNENSTKSVVLSNITNYDTSMTLTNCVGNGFHTNRTVLDECGMEFTQLVPSMGIVEELARRAINKDAVEQNKTVLQEVSMEFTELVPNVNVVSKANKTVLEEECMEMTEVACNFSIIDTLAARVTEMVSANKQFVIPEIYVESVGCNKTVLQEIDMEMTVNNTCVIKSSKESVGKENKIVSPKNHNRTVFQEVDMEITLNNKIPDVIENDGMSEIESKLEKHTVGNKAVSPVLDMEITLKNAKNIAVFENNAESVHKSDTPRQSMRNKNVSIYSKSLIMQNKLMEEALSSGTKVVNVEPSYDDLRMCNYSSVLGDSSSYEQSNLKRMSSKCGSFNIFEDVSGVDLLREVDEMDKKLEEEQPVEFSVCPDLKSFPITSHISLNTTCDDKSVLCPDEMVSLNVTEKENRETTTENNNDFDNIMQVMKGAFTSFESALEDLEIDKRIVEKQVIVEKAKRTALEIMEKERGIMNMLDEMEEKYRCSAKQVLRD